MTRSGFISPRKLLGLCRVQSRRSSWSVCPDNRTILSIYTEADDVVGGFPTAIESIAAILYAFSRNEFRLDDAAAELPLAAAMAQARFADISISRAQADKLKDLQDDIAEDLSWEDTIARCEQILRRR
jgi:hypothetical protein